MTATDFSTLRKTTDPSINPALNSQSLMDLQVNNTDTSAQDNLIKKIALKIFAGIKAVFNLALKLGLSPIYLISPTLYSRFTGGQTPNSTPTSSGTQSTPSSTQSQNTLITPKFTTPELPTQTSQETKGLAAGTTTKEQNVSNEIVTPTETTPSLYSSKTIMALNGLIAIPFFMYFVGDKIFSGISSLFTHSPNETNPVCKIDEKSISEQLTALANNEKCPLINQTALPPVFERKELVNKNRNDQISESETNGIGDYSSWLPEFSFDFSLLTNSKAPLLENSDVDQLWCPNTNAPNQPSINSTGLQVSSNPLSNVSNSQMSIAGGSALLALFAITWATKKLWNTKPTEETQTKIKIESEKDIETKNLIEELKQEQIKLSSELNNTKDRNELLRIHFKHEENTKKLAKLYNLENRPKAIDLKKRIDELVEKQIKLGDNLDETDDRDEKLHILEEFDKNTEILNKLFEERNSENNKSANSNKLTRNSDKQPHTKHKINDITSKEYEQEFAKTFPTISKVLKENDRNAKNNLPKEVVEHISNLKIAISSADNLIEEVKAVQNPNENSSNGNPLEVANKVNDVQKEKLPQSKGLNLDLTNSQIFNQLSTTGNPPTFSQLNADLEDLGHSGIKSPSATSSPKDTSQKKPSNSELSQIIKEFDPGSQIGTGKGLTASLIRNVKKEMNQGSSSGILLDDPSDSLNAFLNNNNSINEKEEESSILSSAPSTPRSQNDFDFTEEDLTSYATLDPQKSTSNEEDPFAKFNNNSIPSSPRDEIKEGNFKTNSTNLEGQKDDLLENIDPSLDSWAKAPKKSKKSTFNNPLAEILNKNLWDSTIDNDSQVGMIPPPPETIPDPENSGRVLPSDKWKKKQVNQPATSSPNELQNTPLILGKGENYGQMVINKGMMSRMGNLIKELGENSQIGDNNADKLTTSWLDDQNSQVIRDQFADMQKFTK